MAIEEREAGPVMINIEGEGADQIILWQFLATGRRAIELDDQLVWDHDFRFPVLLECFE